MSQPCYGDTNFSSGIQALHAVIRDGLITGRSMKAVFITDGAPNAGFDGSVEIETFYQDPKCSCCDLYAASFGQHVKAEVRKRKKEILQWREF